MKMNKQETTFYINEQRYTDTNNAAKRKKFNQTRGK